MDKGKDKNEITILQRKDETVIRLHEKEVGLRNNKQYYHAGKEDTIAPQQGTNIQIMDDPISSSVSFFHAFGSNSEQMSIVANVQLPRHDTLQESLNNKPRIKSHHLDAKTLT
jgi:hypothetical protein